MDFHLRQRETLKGLHNLNHKQLVVRILQPRPLSSCSCHIDRVTVSLPAAFLPKPEIICKLSTYPNTVHWTGCSHREFSENAVSLLALVETNTSKQLQEHLNCTSGLDEWQRGWKSLMTLCNLFLNDTTVSGTQKTTLWAPDSKMNVNIAQMFPFCRLHNQTVYTYCLNEEFSRMKNEGLSLLVSIILWLI